METLIDKLSITFRKITARILDNSIDAAILFEAQQIRYKIFCEDRKWLPQNKKKREWDEYDIFAIHFGAFIQSELVGYVRIIQKNPVGFMFQHEFCELLNGHGSQVDMMHSIEISRLCIMGTQSKSKNILNVLYKAIYQWAKLNNKCFWYIVVDKNHFDFLVRQAFPFEKVGQVHEYQQGVTSTLARLDLSNLEQKLSEKRPDFLKWLKI